MNDKADAGKPAGSGQGSPRLESNTLQRIEFNELTNRLHRNAVAAAALIISINFFSLEISGKAGAAGIEINNLTTNRLLGILFVVMFYHTIAFGIRAREEFKLWKLKLPERVQASTGGTVGRFDLTNDITMVRLALDRLEKEKSINPKEGRTIADDFAKYSKYAKKYAKGLKNFPIITQIRFWIVDIAPVVTMAALALFSVTRYAPDLIKTLTEWFMLLMG